MLWAAIVKFSVSVAAIKHSIIANVNEKNTASIRVVDKLGFKPLGNGKYILKKQSVSRG